MIYECKYCNCLTEYKRSYNRHLKSITHAKNKDIANEKKIYICQYCKIEYVHIKSLYRHNKTCPTQKLKKLEEQLNTEKSMRESSEKNNDFLKDLVKDQTKLVEQAGKIVDKTINMANKKMNALSILESNIKYVPILQKFEKSGINEIINEDNIIKEQYKKYPYEKENHFPEHVIRCYKNDTILEYLSGLIVKEYKKTDPEKQAMWVTDIPRTVFVIAKEDSDIDVDDITDTRILQRIKEHNIEKVHIDWIYDKKGYYIDELIVTPLTNYVKESLIEYIERINKWILDNFDSKLREKKQETLIIGIQIIRDIRTKLINKKMIKTITPYFYMSKEIMKKLSIVDETCI
jgi:hypothetical protein